MIKETKKSIQSILTQRVSSPFYGTLVISWLIWNWKIIYLTFFISEKKITNSKIDFIVSNYSETCNLIWFPLLSTILLLTIIPFITNGAYWLDLIFDNWRVNKKNNIEMKQLLTIEQSISLREQIVNMEKRFETLLADKNTEIEQLKLVINNNGNNVEKNIKITDDDLANNKSLASKIAGNEKLKNARSIIDHFILGEYTGLINADGISPEILSFFISNELMEATDKKTFKWTSKGVQINRIISNEKFN
jgi:hypothetical protein